MFTGSVIYFIVSYLLYLFSAHPIVAKDSKKVVPKEQHKYNKTYAGNGFRFQRFQDLILNGRFWDLTVLVEDAEFHVHKLILAASCELFMSYANNELLGDCYRIKNTSPEVFHTFLSHTYGNGLELTDFNIMGILSLAKLLKCDTAVSGCAEFLEHIKRRSKLDHNMIKMRASVDPPSIEEVHNKPADPKPKRTYWGLRTLKVPLSEMRSHSGSAVKLERDVYNAEPINQNSEKDLRYPLKPSGGDVVPLQVNKQFGTAEKTRLGECMTELKAPKAHLAMSLSHERSDSQDVPREGRTYQFTAGCTQIGPEVIDTRHATSTPSSSMDDPKIRRRKRKNSQPLSLSQGLSEVDGSSNNEALIPVGCMTKCIKAEKASSADLGESRDLPTVSSRDLSTVGTRDLSKVGSRDLLTVGPMNLSTVGVAVQGSAVLESNHTMATTTTTSTAVEKEHPATSFQNSPTTVSSSYLTTPPQLSMVPMMAYSPLPPLYTTPGAGAGAFFSPSLPLYVTSSSNCLTPSVPVSSRSSSLSPSGAVAPGLTSLPASVSLPATSQGTHSRYIKPPHRYLLFRSASEPGLCPPPINGKPSTIPLATDLSCRPVKQEVVDISSVPLNLALKREPDANSTRDEHLPEKGVSGSQKEALQEKMSSAASYGRGGNVVGRALSEESHKDNIVVREKLHTQEIPNENSVHHLAEESNYLSKETYDPNVPESNFVAKLKRALFSGKKCKSEKMDEGMDTILNNFHSGGNNAPESDYVMELKSKMYKNFRYKKFECPHCSEVVKGSDAYKEHIASHRFLCEACHLVMETFYEYKTHLEKCKKHFQFSKDNLRRLEHSRLCKVVYKCEVCSEMFKHKWLLEDHKAKVHDGIGSFTNITSKDSKESV